MTYDSRLTDEAMTDAEFERLAETDFPEARRRFVLGVARAAASDPEFAMAFMPDVVRLSSDAYEGHRLREGLVGALLPHLREPS